LTTKPEKKATTRANSLSYIKRRLRSKMKRYILLITESDSVVLYDTKTAKCLELPWDEVDIQVYLLEDEPNNDDDSQMELEL